MKQLEQHRTAIFRFALNLTKRWDQAEDLTQECLIRGFCKMDQLNQQHNIKSWLFQITRNLWVDLCRKNKIKTDGAQPLDELASASRSNLEQIQIRESLERAFESMQQLPERQREVLFLHAVERFSIDEIASTLEISRNAVKANLSHARKTLRHSANLESPT